ncbi:MAG: fused MFS/spermidine synthase [Polyangiales bacterium]
MPRPPRLLFVLVALSGASALVYEVVWIRALGLHFGTTTPAITTVVATLMAGMGAGNALFGALADRSHRPITLYRRVELGIAASALSVSLLLLHGGDALDGLSRLCAHAGVWSLPLRALLFAALMLVPSTLIGATLPLLTRATFEHGHAGRALGALYACNTLGAIAGALLPDFALVPHFGLTAAACCAAGGNAMVALGAGALQLAPAEIAPRTAASTGPEDAAHAAASSAPIALLLTAATGFCGMGLEVLWSRTLAHWCASLVTSFAVLLAVYLAAIALGASLTAARADRSAAPLRTASLLCALSGVAAIAPVVLAPGWRDFERALLPRPIALRRVGLLREALDALLHATFLEAAACVIMGAAFPYVAAAWLRRENPGARTGSLLAVNTFAAVLGAVAVGFVWLPSLGELGSYCAAGLLLAVFGTLGAALDALRSRAHFVLCATCAICVTAATVVLPPRHLARTHFRSGGRLVAIREGSTTTAAAAQRFAFGEPAYMELLTPGVSMSDTSQSARRYMGVMAHAAQLTARKPERALLICYGVGNTASSLLSHPDLKRLDVVDISEEVLGLAPLFAKARGGRNPLRDPRAHVFVDDGRHHLITHDERYDVITAEPPPPNHAGVVNLYSRELYRLAKRRLAPGGVMTQWLPVFQLSDDDYRAMIAAFVAELPHTALLYGQDKHFVLIGSREPLAADLALAQRRAADPRVRQDMQTAGIGDVADLLGSVLQTDSELRKLVRGVAPLSDDRPSIQYPWAALSGYPDYSTLFGQNEARARALLAHDATNDDPALHAAARATVELTRALSLAGAVSSERAEIVVGAVARRALAARPGNEEPLLLLELGSERTRLAAASLARPGAEALLASAPAQASALGQIGRLSALEQATLTLARRAFLLGDCRATSLLLSGIGTSTTDGALRELLAAGCLRAQGHATEAAIGFRRAASLSHDATFRTLATELAAHAGAPYPREAGPLALEVVAPR